MAIALTAAAVESPFTLLAGGVAPAAPLSGWDHAQVGASQLLFIVVFLGSERMVDKEARH